MKWRLLVILITFLALSLRLYRISDYPVSLYVDEVAIGYNAHSILTTGKDEWGRPLPTNFRSFGDYKLPLYIYLVAASELVVGKTPLAVRLPSVFAGTAQVLVILMLLPSLGVNRKTTLTTGLLLATLPWHIHFSRGGFEATLGLFFTSWGILFLVKNLIKGPTNNPSLLITFILLVLSLYSYHSQRFITPLLILAVFILYKRHVTRETIRRLFLPVLVSLILLFPYFIYTTTQAGLTRAAAESFLPEVKGRPDNFFSQKPILAAEHFLRGYLKNFSPIVLFFTGDGNGRHGVREMGMLYLWQIPLVLIGVIRVIGEIREKNNNKKNVSLLMLAWLIIAPLPAALVRPNPHALRTLPMVIPITYFTAVGLRQAFGIFTRAKSEYQNPNGFGHLKIRILDFVSNFDIRISNLFSLAFCIIIFYFTLQYLHIYYIHYPKRTEPDWNGGYAQAVAYINSIKNNYNEVWFTNNFIEGYIFFAYYGDIAPAHLQQSQYHVTRKLENIVFLPTKQASQFEKGILYIAPSGAFAEGTHLKTIYDTSNNPIFEVWEL